MRRARVAVESNVLRGMDAADNPKDVSPIVAAFDVDMTLTRRDCVIPYLRRLLTWRAVPRMVRWAVPLGWAGVRRDRDRIKALATRITMTGLTRDHLEREGQLFAQEIIRHWMRDDTVARLHWHREQGHHVVLVSASYAMYVQHLGTHLGSTDVLACEVGIDGSERSTGRLIDGNCRGVEKERRLTSWMAARGLTSAAIYAYGDSAGDDQLLAMATWPTRVGSQILAPIPVPNDSMAGVDNGIDDGSWRKVAQS